MASLPKNQALDRQNRALFARLHAGDESARGELLELNWPLVHSIALRTAAKTGRDADNLAGWGVFGLFRAIEKYDPDRGFTFSTYADNWIRNAIQRGELNDDATRIPVWVSTQLMQVRRARGRLGEATAEQLAEATGLKVDEVQAVFEAEAMLGAVSIEAERTKASDGEAADSVLGILADPNAVDPLEDYWRGEIRAAVDALPLIEQAALRLHHGIVDDPDTPYKDEPRSIEEVAVKLGFTFEKTRRTIDRGHRMVRRGLGLE